MAEQMNFNAFLWQHYLTKIAPKFGAHNKSCSLKSAVKLQRNGTALLFKNVNNYLNTNIYSCLETSGGQSYNLH
jgi:hypothetical protein